MTTNVRLGGGVRTRGDRIGARAIALVWALTSLGAVGCDSDQSKGEAREHVPAPMQAVPKTVVADDKKAAAAADLDDDTLAERLQVAKLRAVELDTSNDPAKARALVEELAPMLREVIEHADDTHLRANASLLLGSLYDAIGDLRSAISFYGQAKDLLPQEADVYRPLAVALAADKQFLRAAKAQEVVVEKVPYDLEARLLLGELYFKGGNEDDAVTAYGGYEAARRVLLDCVSLTGKDGKAFKPVVERQICALALAPARDNGTALALLTALKLEPEFSVRVAIVETMGVQRLAGYVEHLEAFKASGAEKDEQVLAAIDRALSAIKEEPVNTQAGPVPETLQEKVKAEAEANKNTTQDPGTGAKITEIIKAPADAKAPPADAKAAAPETKAK